MSIHFTLLLLALSSLLRGSAPFRLRASVGRISAGQGWMGQGDNPEDDVQREDDFEDDPVHDRIARGLS